MSINMVIDEGVLSDEDVREDDNRFHLGELSHMAQKMDYDEQVAVAQMFDTKVLFEVLQTRFTELENVISSVKHLFEER